MANKKGKRYRIKTAEISLMLMFAVMIPMTACTKPIDESDLPKLDTEQTENVAKQTEDTVRQAEDVTNQTDSEPLITEQEAIDIVLGKVPGASEDNITSFGREMDNGWWIYEGELRYNGFEYDFEIDAQTGNILEWEIDD